jgi:kynurenine formamidase
MVQRVVPAILAINRSTLMAQLIDVSHTVADGIITYPGLPGPVVCDFLSRKASEKLYDPGTTFQIGKIDMVANTGTYIDSPFHRYEDGKDLADLPLDRLAHLDALVVDATERGRSLDADLFDGLDLKGRGVLVRTGWDRHWTKPMYFEGHPFLTRQAAELLRESRPALVGIDSLNIDDIKDGSRPVHTLLLGAEIPIVEHLCNLQQLPGSGFRFHAVPVKFRGVGTFPIRAYGVVPFSPGRGIDDPARGT